MTVIQLFFFFFPSPGDEKRNDGACVRSFDCVNVESHKRYSARVCVRVRVCLLLLCVCNAYTCVVCVALYTYMCIQFAGEQRVGVSEETKRL